MWHVCTHAGIPGGGSHYARHLCQNNTEVNCRLRRVIDMRTVGCPPFERFTANIVNLNISLVFVPTLLWESCQSSTERHICSNPPGQDGCHVRLCGCLLVRAFLQSISQLIELLSITKGFLLSQSTPFYRSEEGRSPDSPYNELFGNANVVLMPDMSN